MPEHVLVSFWAKIGSYGVAVAVGGAIYWLLQKLVENKFVRMQEDYRHSQALALQGENTRLSLYNRRFEIFSSIFDFYEAMIAWKGTEEQQAARARFFRAYQESQFLFSKESGVEAVLKRLHEDGMRVIGFKDNHDLYRSDPQLYVRLFEQTQTIQTTVFDQGLSDLKAAISPYLRFDSVQSH